MVVGDDRLDPHVGGLAPEARNRFGGFLLLGAGAILLFVSLFLDWYEPGISAWTTFEVWDMVLAALALMAVAAAAGALGFARPLPDRAVLAASVLAPVIVVMSLVNHPPAAQGLAQDPMTGIWLALAGSLLMALGAAAAVARISVAVVADPVAPAARPRTRFARERHDASDPAVSPAGEAVPPPAAAGAPVTEPTRRVVP